MVAPSGADLECGAVVMIVTPYTNADARIDTF
jgi:hypothetical protein